MIGVTREIEFPQIIRMVLFEDRTPMVSLIARALALHKSVPGAK